MKKIRKAVIPAAGLGTRFLPASKAMAKEIMPIVDKPVIQFIVEEVLASGIEEILVITGRNKRSIEDHFDANIELENNLESKQKLTMLEMVRNSTLGNIQFKRQHYPKGLGDAVLQAKSFVGDEPFLLTLGDDILEVAGDETASEQVIKAAMTHDAMTVLTQTVPKEEAHQYGVVYEGEVLSDNVAKIQRLVEKPSETTADAQAICGRYVLTSEIFEVLENLTANAKSGEIELTDALSQLAEQSTLLSCHFSGDWYEVGEPFGLVKASIQHSLNHPEIKEGFRALLKEDIIPRLKAEENK
ncbi:MAG: UTP--glucose-1-phosphate uridylyltransferase [Aerococcus sp.]|nr:UTP--glucose-1-phosphate uridylyltransferase [Aerococcus sp.]